MPADKVQFRPAALAAALATRADADDNAHVSQVAQRDLGRYYELMALALASVNLAPGEAALVVDALNGTIADVQTAQLLAYEVQDSLADGLAVKWDVDGAALVATIGAWSLAQRLAVVDAAERFWRGPYRGEGPIADKLAAVGLIRRG
ncbi:MAG TPA: hypothetical protein PKD53_14205 [Chloroflexaceae bacterium]|nr:hypothetical protein [Chloroflexaceae bacterium]